MTRPKSNLGYRQVKTKTARRYREKKNPPNSVLEEEAQSVPEYEQQSASTPEEESVLVLKCQEENIDRRTIKIYIYHNFSGMSSMPKLTKYC